MTKVSWCCVNIWRSSGQNEVLFSFTKAVAISPCLPIILCTSLCYTDLVKVADAASGESGENRGTKSVKLRMLQRVLNLRHTWKRFVLKRRRTGRKQPADTAGRELIHAYSFFLAQLVTYRVQLLSLFVFLVIQLISYRALVSELLGNYHTGRF